MKPALVWDEWNIDHIKKYKASVQEVEEAYQRPLFETKAKAGRTLLVAKLKNGRMITVYLSYQKQTRPYLVSARDSSKKERRTVYEII